MSPRTPRPFLDPIWNPHGGSAAVRDIERRVQRIERAPVTFTLERFKEPKKAPKPPAPMPGAAGLLNYVAIALLAADPDDIVGMTSPGWESVRKLGVSPPSTAMWTFVKNPPWIGDPSTFAVGDKIHDDVNALTANNASWIQQGIQATGVPEGFIAANSRIIWVASYVAGGTPNSPTIVTHTGGGSAVPNPVPLTERANFVFGVDNEYRLVLWTVDECTLDPPGSASGVRIDWGGQVQNKIMGSMDVWYEVISIGPTVVAPLALDVRRVVRALNNAQSNGGQVGETVWEWVNPDLDVSIEAACWAAVGISFREASS